jgi:hypothetical protein
MEPMGEGSVPVQTVAGLFDDDIDAGHALSALRKATGESVNISVLAKDRVSGDSVADGPVDVTKAVMDTAFSTVGNWLSGLAALMVPQRGSFLAAGPIGVALTGGSSGFSSVAVPEATVEQPSVTGSLASALERFGFRPDAAHYIEERLTAGSAMIAVTDDDRARIESTLQTFADFNAVFIGQAETPADILVETERWALNPLSTTSSDVVVADVVAALGHVCADPDHYPALRDWCGLDVFDRHGGALGEIDDLLADATDPSRLRYVIVGHGGVLGIARRRVAVPAPLVSGGERAVRLIVDRDRFAGAPLYHADTPFSRRDELNIHAYFETKPYWDAG